MAPKVEPSVHAPGLTQEAIADFLVEAVSRLAELDPSEVGTDRPFAEYGLDSAQILELTGDLSELLGRELPDSLAWEYPTIHQMSAYLAGNPVEPAAMLAELDLE